MPPAPSARLVRRTALGVAVALGALVVTGAGVRLSGSGLGCPTWPHCEGSSVVAGHGLHWAVELGNRTLTTVVFAVIVALAVMVMLRRPLRRDHMRLIVALLAGYVVQAVLGGITVLTRLNPLAVAAHFLTSMVLLWIGVLLYRRTGVELVDPRPVVRPELRQLGRLIVATAGLVLVIGTLVTGSGPHAGARVDNRLPFPLHAIAQLHSDVVLFLVGSTLVTCVALRLADAPPRLQRRGWVLLAVMGGQTAVGFIQYFLGLPAGLVALHVAGATLLWALALTFAMEMWERPPLAALAAPVAQPRIPEPAAVAGAPVRVDSRA